MQQALAGAEVSGTRSSATLGTKLLYVALPVGSAGGIQGAVRITYPGSVIDDQIRHIWLLLAATGGVVLGIVFLVSLLLAGSMTRPLADLETAAGELGAGDLSARAEVPKGPAELTVLAESFNATAARLEQLVGAQRGFVADASHQLRTPLAAMRLRLENLEADVDGAAAEDLEGALAEVSRLSRLVDGLLVLMRAEQSTSDPAPIVGRGRARRPVRRLGRVRGREARAHRRRRWRARRWRRATPGRLEQVVDNLLNNALEVAPPGSAVRLVAGELRRLGRAAGQRRGPGHDRPRSAPTRSTGSGSRARPGATVAPTVTSASGSRSCASSWSATAVTSRSAPSDGGGLEVVVRMKREPTHPVAPRARQLSTASAT